MDGLELLTTAEMAEADRLAVAHGVPSLTLMENAGRAVAAEAAGMVPAGARIAVLCGPGNNGGDGFVAARLLAERGFAVSVFALRPIEALKGDAAVMARRWTGEVRPLASFLDPEGACSLAIDALFGTGYSGSLPSEIEKLVWAVLVVAAAKRLLAVDVPSGVDATTGAVAEWSQHAVRTVTFFRRKLGHVLFPARALCGEIVVADIGIPDAVVTELSTRAVVNTCPRSYALAQSHGRAEVHKYTRGHAVVVSGPAFATGAARLGARGALRIGAGLVTVASPTTALIENAAHLTAIMLKPCNSAKALADLLADKRKNAVLIGPGAGVGEETLTLVEAALGSGAACVLDADALTSYATGKRDADDVPRVGFGFTKAAGATATGPEALFAAIKANAKRAVVLTPHEGEFKRLFPDVTGSKLERARKAAERSGAVVILKGPDTVIAAPDGFAHINDNAPPTLATAGSGDVLAGFVAGLLAQKMPAFEAACAAVWLHGECANLFGPGLIAEDLPEQLPKVLAALRDV